MKNPALFLVLLAAAVLAGCAHPMTIKPDIGALGASPAADSQRIQKYVGLYIAAADRAKQVTTAGGGGDKVTYAPYADLETGLYKVLGDSFVGVAIVQSPTDTETITKKQLAYVVQPDITTTSSSKGFFTWMATDFSVTVACKITDASGQPVTTVSATGTGKATSDELMKNFSAAGERASQDALIKLRGALLDSPALKK
jgi:hypothetical protein